MSHPSLPIPATPASRAIPDLDAVPAPRPASPDDGSSIAGFVVLAELGRGAGSRVLRVRRAGAKDGELDYALKLLDTDPEDTDRTLTALLREAALLAGLSHPGLPTIHEVGRHDHRPYLVMDLVEGVQLAELLSAGRLPLRRVLEVAADVAGQLAAVHGNGLVHRDIKPQNIMILPSGEARLIDFGLAAREAGGAEPATVGTMIYVAPEQAGVLRRPTDNRSDLYSLGVVLYECFSGQVPFVSDDVGELLRMHAVAAPPDLHELAPDLPAPVTDLVTTLLAKDPDDRYQTAQDLAVDLGLLTADPDSAIVPRAGRARHGSRPLVGRSRELGELREHRIAALAGAGRACVIRGAPGSGKSRLAQELALEAADGGVLVLAGKCSADDPVPLGPLRATLAAHLSDVAGLGEVERARAYDRIRTAAAGAEGVVGGLTPGLGELLGTSRTPTAQDQFTLAVATFLVRLARASGGLVLVVDDLQWLDTGTARVLAQLCGELGSAPLLVLGTARDDAMSRAATDEAMSSWREAVTLDLTLPPLDAAGVGELVAGMLPGIDFGAGLSGLSQLLDVRGNGNPFVVQEYVRAIVDAGLLRPSWGTWVLDEAGLDALALPQDALGLVLTRVGSLGLQARELLTTAAALGVCFPLEVLGDLHGLAPEAVQAVATEASQHRLVEPDGAGYRFLHDRIREALLEPLDAAAVADLHLRIARTLDAAPARGGRRAERVYAIARHYLAADDEDSAVPTLEACRAAGLLALESRSPAEAATYLRRAVQLDAARAGRDGRDTGLLLALADALRQDARFSESLDRLGEVLEIERDPGIRATAYRISADVHRSCWNTTAAAGAVQLGLTELGAGLPGSRLLKVLSTALMFVVAFAIRRTGVGLGWARGRQRERCAQIAGLHEVGGYVAVLAMRPAEMVMHDLRGLFWANRLGHGAQYARTEAGFAFVCGQLGLRRGSRRSFARVRADASFADPGVQALTAHYEGASAYLRYLDDGELWAAAADEHGRNLDPAAYGDLVNALINDEQARGRSRAAQEQLRTARHRLAHRAGELALLSVDEAVSLALTGRPVEAVAALRRAEQSLGDAPAQAVAIQLANARLAVLREQDETGERFDEAAAGFAALSVPPAVMIRSARTGYFHLAMGRLAQCRAASGADREVRLRQAGSAVRTLRLWGKGDAERTRAGIARADLLVLRGRPAAALAVLSRGCDELAPDAPLLAYEIARVRARALAALGRPEQSQRQAQLAGLVAEESGWPHRKTWVRKEFGLDTPDRGGRYSATHRNGTAAAASRSALPVGTGETSRPAPGMERLRLKALEEVGAAASRVVDPGELARITLDETIRILGADRAFLFLVEGSGGPPRGSQGGHEASAGRLVPHLGRDATKADVEQLTGYSASLVERVHRTGEPLVVTGTEEGAALGAESVVLHGLRSIMVAPLALEGRMLGVVYLDSQVAKGIFTAEDVGLLTALTNHIATSLETARAAQLEISVQTAQRQRDLADALRQALEAMSAADGPQQVLARLMSWAVRVTSATGVRILSEDGGHLLLTAPEDGPAGADALRTRTLETDPELTALVGSTGPVVGVACPAALHGELTATTSWVALPLRTGDGRPQCLLLAGDAPGARLDDEVEVAEALVALGVTAHQKAMLFDQVQAMAAQDELTGIPNRRSFFELAGRGIAAAARAGRPAVVMMIDIDHFKLVNDTYGHPTGDDVIRVVAARLSSVLRAVDLVGRYGGEEFAVFLPDVDPGGALPERLRTCISRQPVDTRSGPLAVTVSVGVSSYPTGAQDVGLEKLLADADRALYAAKEQGRDCVVMADP